MGKTIEEIKNELLKDMPEGYILPDDDESFLRKRLKANQFCKKRFNENPRSMSEPTSDNYKSLWNEFKANGDLFYIVWHCFNIGYYKGYMKAKAELKERRERS